MIVIQLMARPGGKFLPTSSDYIKVDYYECPETVSILCCAAGRASGSICHVHRPALTFGQASPTESLNDLGDLPKAQPSRRLLAL